MPTCWYKLDTKSLTTNILFTLGTHTASDTSKQTKQKRGSFFLPPGNDPGSQTRDYQIGNNCQNKEIYTKKKPQKLRYITLDVLRHERSSTDGNVERRLSCLLFFVHSSESHWFQIQASAGLLAGYLVDVVVLTRKGIQQLPLEFISVSHQYWKLC